MKFKLVEDFEDNRKIILEVKFEVYGRYGDGGEIITAKVSGKDLRHALMRMVDKMRLYIDSDDIKEKNLTTEQILDSISETNGDGCDMIYHLKNLTTGEVLIDCFDCYEKQDWDDDFDESLKESRKARIKIPAPYNKYFEIDTDPYLDHDGYKPGDTVDYATILAYVNVKEEYEDFFDAPEYMLIDDAEFPIVDIIHDRLYPVEIPRKMNENFSKEFESRELLDTGELMSSLKALIKEYGHMELEKEVYLETVENDHGRQLKIGFNIAESLTEAVKTPVIPEPYDKYFEIIESEPYYYAKECSYDIAREIAHGAKVALRLPAHEVEMLEHDINNLRSNEWVDQFKQLSDRSKVKRLFFKYAVEPEGYVPGDKVSGATILAEVAPKDEYVEMFDSIYNLIDDPDFPVVEIVHDRLFPVDLPLDEGLFNLIPSISASVSIGEDVENTSGSGLKDALKNIFSAIAKDDKNSWAKTAGIVVDNVSESDMENIVNVISDKFSDVAVSDSDKDKISKECPEKADQIKTAKTIGNIIDILDLRTLCKNNPDAVKSIVTVVLAIIAVIEPTPIVEVITGIVAALPSDVIAKILEIVLSLDLGHIVLGLIRKLLDEYINKETAPND